MLWSTDIPRIESKGTGSATTSKWSVASRQNMLRSYGYLVQAETLFPDEQVTKDEALIHAYGKDKAVEYLKVLAATFRLMGPEG